MLPTYVIWAACANAAYTQVLSSEVVPPQRAGKVGVLGDSRGPMFAAHRSAFIGKTLSNFYDKRKMFLRAATAPAPASL